ncbi:MAG: PSD1 and planctomycete cytochrome C domain-containing protein [Lentisphaerales bacterium]|nr:PSD1 and planctomycete cytochrome C domain-containing protein [Lentisphaerales bacterium]
MKRVWIAVLAGLSTLLPLSAENIPEKVTFNEHIRPIFSSTCFDCHGPDAHEAKAHLQLHSFDAATQPRTYTTKSGKKKTKEPVIIPGSPAKSAVWERISTNDEDDIMPPVDFHHELSERDKALVKKWIEQGAEYQAHWAYEPIAKFEQTNIPSTIDKMVLQKLQAEGFSEQNPLDNKLVLARRLSLDLRGLLPTQKELYSFINDKSPKAWENLVDNFMADKAYGERMGTHWFDVVRYSNSVGFHGDQELRSAPYRDYVIKAFNDNMPYDQFTKEQLAGDLLENPTRTQTIATAYNRLNKVTKEGGAQPGEYLAKYATDRVSNLSAVWLGSTLECAECHNHKYDPFTAEDFYSMSAFFADIKQTGVYKGGNNKIFAPELFLYTPEQEKEARRLKKQLNKIKNRKSKEYKALLKKENTLNKSVEICVITETQEPRVTRILPRGNWMDQTGKIVEPAVPHFMQQINKEGRANRLDLANWLCSEDNPMAARAFMNRIWAMYFGQGITQIEEDLGSQGELPVNPELLDFLARKFIDSNWNVKSMVKGIVMSKTYRLSTNRSPQMIDKDPYNRLLARQSILRLNAEFIRDSTLQVSGLLNKKIGGRNIMPYQPADYYASMNFNPFKYRPEKDQEQYRRAVYMHWQRTFLHPFLKNFDAPEREVGICARTPSNTPLQALTLLNDPSFVEAAKALAERTLKEGGSSLDKQLAWIIQNCLGRSANPIEVSTMKELYGSQVSYFKSNPQQADTFLKIGNKQADSKLNKAQLAAMAQVARAVMNLHEFIVRR